MGIELRIQLLHVPRGLSALSLEWRRLTVCMAEAGLKVLLPLR